VVVTYAALVGILAPESTVIYANWKVGDVPDRSIKAPFSFMVLDQEATQQARADAENKVAPVFVMDDSVLEKALQELETALEEDESFKELSSTEKKKVKAALEEVIKDIFSRGIVRKEDARYLPRDGELRIKEGDTERLVKRGDVYTPETVLLIVRARISQKLGAISRETRDAAIDLAYRLLNKTNLAFDKEATMAERKAARENVTPIYYAVQKGEYIVQEGVKLKEEDIWKLEALRAEFSGKRLLLRIAGVGILLAAAFAVMGVYLHRFERKAWGDIKALSMMGTGIIIVAVISKLLSSQGYTPLYAPVAFLPILIAVLISSRVALMTALLTALVVGMVGAYKMDGVIAVVLGCVAGVFASEHVRNRAHLIRAGLLVGSAYFVVMAGFAVLGDGYRMDALGNALKVSIVNGGLCALIVPGLLPVFEHAFKLTSNIKLLELSDLNHPLLKELATKAPGTFQSSLIVGHLAEVAADAVGANSLLARVAAYYHDIGKIFKPEYFSENQQKPRDRARHEKLTPKMSSLVLISHVKDGVELAYQYRLPEEIINIIREHHGTTLTSFFYEKAKEEDDSLREEDFRYPGPKPQSREAAIVMLADSVEAAARSLPEPTPARLAEVVKKIINNKFLDGQLDECELTLRDLSIIEKCFLRVLTSVFHTRIEYPEKEGGKRGNNSDKRGGSGG